MKNLKRYLICILLLSSVHVFSQSKGVGVSTNMNGPSDFALSRTILLDADTKASEILVEVPEGTSKLSLRVEGSIEGGKLAVEVFNPKGERTGHFNLSAQVESAKKEVANGNFSKSLVNPQIGEWKIKIIPENVNGMIHIESMLTEK